VNDLVLIPARGGSKGIPGKNIKHLNGRPLIYYTLDAACEITAHQNICVSTDSDKIITYVKEYGLEVPFKRPAKLATDTAGSQEVILHAIDFYEKTGVQFDRIILLQPTSPFRTGFHIQQALALYEEDLDMIVSVKETKANPYYNLFEENEEDLLVLSKPSNFDRRQDCPAVYELNGAIYIINNRSLKNGPISHFSRIKKYVMPEENSIDLDTELDWIIADAVMRHNIEEGV
jgi:CMP-N,N'-diacetyllegionaminic acid synthase